MGYVDRSSRFVRRALAREEGFRSQIGTVLLTRGFLIAKYWRRRIYFERSENLVREKRKATVEACEYWSEVVSVY